MNDNLPRLLPPPEGSEQSEQECVDLLLKKCPAVVEMVTRSTLERLIRTAFRGAWILALNPEARDLGPTGTIH